MNKVKVKLVGENGNIFNLMAKASQALKAEGFTKEAEEMKKKIMDNSLCGSYNEALQIIREYCDVS